MRFLSYQKVFTIILFVALIVGVVIFVNHDNANKVTPSKINTPTNKNHQAGTFPTSFTINGVNGESRVMGVKVDSLSGNTLTTSGMINNTPISFIIKTDNKTIIKGATASSSPKVVKVGDTLFVTGVFQSFAPQITVLATEVRIISSISL